MTTTEQNQNSSANTSEEKDPNAFYDKNGKLIPADHFENEPSPNAIQMSDEDLDKFDAETERLKQFKG
jgi:hypothetical protein